VTVRQRVSKKEVITTQSAEKKELRTGKEKRDFMGVVRKKIRRGVPSSSTAHREKYGVSGGL